MNETISQAKTQNVDRRRFLALCGAAGTASVLAASGVALADSKRGDWGWVKLNRNQRKNAYKLTQSTNKKWDFQAYAVHCDGAPLPDGKYPVVFWYIDENGDEQMEEQEMTFKGGRMRNSIRFPGGQNEPEITSAGVSIPPA